LIFYEDGSICLVVNNHFQVQMDLTSVAFPLAFYLNVLDNEEKVFGIQILFFGFIFLWGGEE
jgi:hypothetical protein